MNTLTMILAGLGVGFGVIIGATLGAMAIWALIFALTLLGTGVLFLVRLVWASLKLACLGACAVLMGVYALAKRACEVDWAWILLGFVSSGYLMVNWRELSLWYAVVAVTGLSVSSAWTVTLLAKRAMSPHR